MLPLVLLLSLLLPPAYTLLSTNSVRLMTRFLSLPVPNLKLKKASVLTVFMYSCTSAKQSIRDRDAGERMRLRGIREGTYVDPNFAYGLIDIVYVDL